MTVKLKNLIQQRQSAFHANKHSNVYKALRNTVNRERKSCKAKYYSSKVEDLKGTNPKQWWREMKKLSGLSNKSSTNRVVQRVPITWRTANITPIPKVRQVTNLKNELRPISLTRAPCLSKMAEELIVNDYIKPAVLKIIDPCQFGTVPGSSTVMALISMFHKWLGDTDGTGSTIRVLLCDYSKAFDLIDHRLLVNKIKQLDIPNSVINWVISFLTYRPQRVKLGHDCFSEWGAVPSGVP